MSGSARGGRRVLSSKWLTWQYKYFWPVITVAFFVGMGIACWRVPTQHDTERAIWFGRVMIPIIGTASSVLAIWYGSRMKRVEMDDAGLYVFSSGRETVVSFSEIETCQVSWKGKGKDPVPLVTVQLSQRRAFGSKIIFLAAAPWNTGHSIVAELRERRDQALGKSPVV